MKKMILNALVLIGLTVTTQSFAQSTTDTAKDKKAIEAVIAVYQKALATSDAALASTLYTKTAKFMPSGGPSAIGTDAIKGSYAYVFSLITPTIEFTIDEVVFIGKHAYVTSTSKGVSLIKANNQTVPEINRELFLFEKENGVWKIARYMFNKMTN
jgi:uncharacterized protein (TIGR02246 family)